MNLNAASLPLACRIKFRFFSGTSKSCRPGLSPSVEPYRPQLTFISSYFRPDCLLFLCFFIFVGCSFICICTSSNVLLLAFCILSPPRMQPNALYIGRCSKNVCCLWDLNRSSSSALLPEGCLPPSSLSGFCTSFHPSTPSWFAFAHFSFGFITRPQTVHRRPAKREPGGKSQVISPVACDHYNLWLKSNCTVVVFAQKLS